jgi:hypothetical protein
MSVMKDIQLQFDELNERVKRIEVYLTQAGIVPPADVKSDRTVVQPHWAFEDPENDNKWRA